MKIELLELINLIGDNPTVYEGKQFKVVSGGVISTMGVHYSKLQVYDGKLCIMDGEFIRTPFFTEDTELEEIKPVDFIVALNSPKRKKSEFSDNYLKTNEIIDFLFTISPESQLKYINGRWYLED